VFVSEAVRYPRQPQRCGRWSQDIAALAQADRRTGIDYTEIIARSPPNERTARPALVIQYQFAILTERRSASPVYGGWRAMECNRFRKPGYPQG